jgi:cyclic-di-GMP phosphodiesterase TipF (flagellum assembly factor)
MQRLGALFIAICMVVISASVGVILTYKFGLTILEAAPFAVGVLLTLMLVHYQISRVRDRLIIDEQMDDLTRLKLSLTKDVQDVRELTEQLEQTVTTRMRGEMDPILAELDLMGTLVKQLAESCAELDERVELNEERAKVLKSKMDQATKTMAQIQKSLSSGALGAREKPQATKVADADKQQETKTQSQQEIAQPEAELEAEQPALSEEEQKASTLAASRAKAEEAAKALESIANLHHGQHKKAVSEEEKQAVRRALAMGKMELHLQPIVSLPMRKPSFYVMLARLLVEQGNVITPDVFLPVCKELNFLPLLDRLAINKAFKMQRSLVDRGHGMPCFCNISLESMSDPDFFAHLRELYEQNTDLVENIILEFSLTSFSSFGVLEEDTMQLMQSMGFRFSVDQLTSLKADFDHMVRSGIRFAKVAAPILTHRDAGRGMDIHPADFSRVLSRKGLDLVVTHVETESALVGLLDYNIKLAQGNHFAPAKPLRPEETSVSVPASVANAAAQAARNSRNGAAGLAARQLGANSQSIPAPIVHGTGGRMNEPAPAPAAARNERTLGQNPRVAQALKAMSAQDGEANPTRDHFRNVLAEAAGLMEPQSGRANQAERPASGAASPGRPRLQRVIR